MVNARLRRLYILRLDCWSRPLWTRDTGVMINLCDTTNYILIFKYPLTDVPCNNQERLSLKFKVHQQLINGWNSWNYNPGQNVLGHLRKLGTKTHFAKLTHILPLKKAWGCCYKGLFLLSPSPPSSIDYVELKLECITSTLHRGVRGERRCLNLTSYCISVPRVWTRAVVWLMTLMFEGPTSSSWTWAEMR